MSLILNQNSLTDHQTIEVNRLTLEIIEGLDDFALGEMLGGNEKDIDRLIATIQNETASSVYGTSINGSAISRVGEFNTGSIYYLEKLTNSIEDTLRIENFTYFLVSVMGEDVSINWHHLEWAEIVRCYIYFCVLAARGHGKSWFFSNFYPAWKLYRYKKYSKRKDLSKLGKEGYLFSFSVKQAIRILDDLKGLIIDNPLLKETLYPGSSDGWAATQIKCKNGAKLSINGMGAAVRGAHPGWIVCDDVLKDNVITSADQRNKMTSYFHSVIMNLIEPGGQVAVVGTPMHFEDLYGDLKKKKGWHVREYPAIFPDGKILWDGRFDFQSLMMKRETQGSLNFSREILCRPITNDTSIFLYEDLIKSTVNTDKITMCNNIESWNGPVLKRVCVGIDLAISANIGSDDTVIIVGGVDELERLWILNIIKMNGKTYSEQIQKIKSVNLNYRPSSIWIEGNGFQRIFVQESLTENMPVFSHITTGSTKNDMYKGVPGLAIKFQLGKVKIPTGDQYSVDKKDSLFSQLQSMSFTNDGIQGVGNHDDEVMALHILDFNMTNQTQSLGYSFL